MKWFNIFFGCYWLGMGIAVWCGYSVSPLFIGCGFLCAALGFFGDALNESL